MVMSLPVSASVPDLAMTIPTGFAAALGIWFATTTAILIAETGLARRIAKFRLFSTWQPSPVTEVRAALPLEQQRVTPRQRRGARPADRQPASVFQISRILLRIAAFAFGLGVALPTLAQTISGSSLNITGQSTLQGDVVTCSGPPWLVIGNNANTAPAGGGCQFNYVLDSDVYAVRVAAGGAA